LVNPGVKLEDIKEVHSHPMAIQQCFGFLDKYNWKLVETEDTALSAKHIHQHKNKHAAAIASKLAAELYGLNMIAPNIHTLKNNYTRFLVCSGRIAVNEVAGCQIKPLLIFYRSFKRKPGKSAYKNCR
jgi:prephenate dehydratase